MCSEPLWIAIRPWIHFNGTVNEAALDSFLIRILSYIIKVPALSLIGLQRKFLPALQPHCTRELLEVINFAFFSALLKRKISEWKYLLILKSQLSVQKSKSLIGGKIFHFLRCNVSCEDCTRVLRRLHILNNVNYLSVFGTTQVYQVVHFYEKKQAIVVLDMYGVHFER